MNKLNSNLDIYNILDVHEYGFQQCLLPQEFFNDSLTPGTIAICTTNEDEQFLCYLSSLGNICPKDHCFLDDTVQVSNKTKPRNGSKLIEIQPLAGDIAIAPKLEIEVEINMNLFDVVINKNHLSDIIKEWLRNFVLYRNCTIRGEEYLKEFGIENLLIKSHSETLYKTDTNTEIILTDVRYKEAKLNFTELRGLSSIQSKLNKFIGDYTLQKNTDWKMKMSFNALLIGPTGSGKTSVCHNMFLENHCNVFNVRPSDIIRQYPGETEKILRDIFNKVQKFIKKFDPQSPSIIFIEDIDILCPKASSDADSANIMRVSSQIYSILDEIHSKQLGIISIATTSKIDNVNVQLRRPGRFEKEIQVHVPSEKDREDILRLFLDQSPLKTSVSDDTILGLSARTPGFVGSDLMLLVENTLRLVILEKKSIEIDDSQLKIYFEKVLKTSKTSSLQGSDIKVYKCTETFKDIGGAHELKNVLTVSILAPLKRPEVFQKFGLQLPKGILLYGPPGCAKTTVAKCLAEETNMTFISISGAEVYSPYVGNAEKYIAKIFDAARRNSPCLIFFDEIETLVGKRNLTSKSDVQTRILSSLLQEMDGIGLKIDSGIKTNQNENHILVVGATNRPDMIDDALLRPGRFDKLIHVPAPDAETRLAILKLRRSKMPFEENLDLEKLVERTEFFSGADICNLCNEAALNAFTRNRETELIREDDFDVVLKELKPSLSLTQIDWYKNFANKCFS